jgi:hypothetical protein
LSALEGAPDPAALQVTATDAALTTTRAQRPVTEPRTVTLLATALPPAPALQRARPFCPTVHFAMRLTGSCCSCARW